MYFLKKSSLYVSRTNIRPRMRCVHLSRVGCGAIVF